MVQRYSINECASTGMDHNDEGDYVLFDDYEDKLLDAKYDYDQLQKKYDRLIGILGDLYREG